jgi:hypothetical protein
MPFAWRVGRAPPNCATPESREHQSVLPFQVVDLNDVAYFTNLFHKSVDAKGAATYLPPPGGGGGGGGGGAEVTLCYRAKKLRPPI